MLHSLWPRASHPPQEILASARYADEHGWHGVWVADHYMPDTGSTRVVSGDVHEVWALLPAIAAVTERVRLGPLVSPTSVHHPALLANRAATLDHLSGGRLVLGLGAGWQVNEHAAYGIELEAPGARVTRFEEAVQVIRSLHTQERTDFHGRCYDLTDAACDPKPLQSPLPLLAGTAGPRMLRITARHLDEWNTWGDPETAASKRQRLLEACEQVGRDPDTLHCSVQAVVHPFRDAEADGRTISGSAEQLLDALGRYAEAGFEEFIVPDATLGATVDERHETLDRLDAEVLSRL